MRALPRGRDLTLRETRDGAYLAKRKTVTGFAIVEEEFADNAAWNLNPSSRDRHVKPWRVEDELATLAAN